MANSSRPSVNSNRSGAPQVVSPVIFQGKFAAAFWTVTGLISIAVNIILIVILIFLGQQLFSIKGLVQEQLIEGLAVNFEKMDQAAIQTSVQVEDSIPVQFDLPVSTNTTVVLTEATPISGASVVIKTGILDINAPADIVLPAGLALPISLNITVPVDASVPVVLTVPVDIPLNETELHEPFVGLQEVVAPYNQMLGGLPNAWDETPICQGFLNIFCQMILTPAK